MDGWLKLHRSIIDSAVFDDADVLRVWIWLLCNVAFEEHDVIYCGKVIHLRRGQIATGRKKISQQMGVSENKVYRALNILKTLGNININPNNKFSLITVENWAKFQQEPTAKQQQNNGKATAKPTAKQHNKRNKERKECKRMNEIEPRETRDRSSTHSVDSFFSDTSEKEYNELTALGGIGKGSVLLSQAQIDSLLEQLSLEEFNKYVEIVADAELSGKKYTRKTHYQAILDMVDQDRKTTQ